MTSEDPQTWVFSPEDGGNIFIRNFGIYLQVHAVLQPTRHHRNNRPSLSYLTFHDALSTAGVTQRPNI